MRRGEIRIVGSRVSGRETLALIIGSDSLNESDATGWVMTAPITTTGAAPDLVVMVPVVSPVEGVVRLDSVQSVRKERIGDLVGRVQPEVMEALNMALRAALDL